MAVSDIGVAVACKIPLHLFVADGLVAEPEAAGHARLTEALNGGAPTARLFRSGK